MRTYIALSIIVSLASSPCPAWADDAPKGAAYKLEPGPFTVQTAQHLVLHDAKRKKQLQLRINYPDGTGPFPVIVWSHGAGGTKSNYLPLTEYWASHGYVTIQPNHSDSRALGTAAGDPTRFRDWQSRPADISFILDSLAELEKQEPALKGKIVTVHPVGTSFGSGWPVRWARIV